MRTALWMVDGTTQIVLSPETEWERVALKQIKSGTLTVFEAEFFDCQGGYWRGVSRSTDGLFGVVDSGPRDTILRIDATTHAPEATK